MLGAVWQSLCQAHLLRGILQHPFDSGKKPIRPHIAGGAADFAIAFHKQNGGNGRYRPFGELKLNGRRCVEVDKAHGHLFGFGRRVEQGHDIAP